MLKPRYQSSLDVPAARQLSHRRAEPVREVELKRVAAGALLDAERAVVHARLVADPRDDLADQVDGRAYPDTRADAER